MSLVSIITPAYNADKYIATTIESVLAQTYHNWEMIIVDDGSTDHTASVVAEYVLKDSRIHYVYQKNARQGKARNNAIARAKGRYIAFLDADDLWFPDKLCQQMQVFKDDPSVGLVYSSGYFMDHSGMLLEAFDTKAGRFDQGDTPGLFWGNYVPILSVIVRKEDVVRVGGFIEDTRYANVEDYCLWMHLKVNGVVFFGLPNRLFGYRMHPEQSTGNDAINWYKSVYALDLFLHSGNQLLASICRDKYINYMVHHMYQFGVSHVNMVIADYCRLFGHGLVKRKLLRGCSLLLALDHRYAKIIFNKIMVSI